MNFESGLKTRGVVFFAASLALVMFCGCTKQGYAYSQSPVCRQAENTCKQYEKARKQAGSDRGAGLQLLREDCEGSQRACVESMRSFEPSIYPEQTPARSWQDALWK